MSQAPSMPMFWDAYLADTTHLTTEEHGAYMLLLAAMWRRNGWVPDDDKDNARILGLTPAKWKRVKERLSVFLIFQDGQITQKNLLKIWKITQEKIEKNRENGAKGGRPKTRENKGIEKANGSVSQKPNETIPEPEPEPYIRQEEAKASLSSCDDLGGAKPFDEITEAVKAYNDSAEVSGWPQLRILSKQRRASLKARLKECGGLDGWHSALERARGSPHLCGQNDRGWTANFDFLTRQSSFAKLMEGNYDPRNHTSLGTGASGPDTGMVAAFAAVAARRAAQSGRG